MAKDDYQVIVYQILSYLYNCLKKDIEVNPEYLKAQGEVFNINEKYWRFILFNLSVEGYIEGIQLTQVWGEKYPKISQLENIGITPTGIQYLTDDSFINQVKEILKDTKAIIPFV